MTSEQSETLNKTKQNHAAMNDPLRLIWPMIKLKGKSAPTRQAVFPNDYISNSEKEIIQSFIFCEKGLPCELQTTGNSEYMCIY